MSEGGGLLPMLLGVEVEEWRLVAVGEAEPFSPLTLAGTWPFRGPGWRGGRQDQERRATPQCHPFPSKSMAGAIIEAADVGVVGRDVVQLFLRLNRRDA